MFYSIRHLTRFQYSDPVYESVMEARMRPRGDGAQRCLSFKLGVTPKARVHSYRDHLGNSVHHFDVPGSHTRLAVLAESTVEVEGDGELPMQTDMADWMAVDQFREDGGNWEFLAPSRFAHGASSATDLAKEFGVERRADPMSLIRDLNSRMYSGFEYDTGSTTVDSPIDDAIATRKGVCQDFAHIMITLVRGVGIPCRYISGYVYADRTDRASADASHAWVEANIPGVGWVGFDPTNNIMAGDRHIRTAIGRDYADVPPTRGVHKGAASSTLTVSVRVTTTEAPADEAERPVEVERYIAAEEQRDVASQQEQQEQQQQ